MPLITYSALPKSYSESLASFPLLHQLLSQAMSFHWLHQPDRGNPKSLQGSPNIPSLWHHGNRARSGPLGFSGQPPMGGGRGGECLHQAVPPGDSRAISLVVPSRGSRPRLTAGCGGFGTSSSPEAPRSCAAPPQPHCSHFRPSASSSPSPAEGAVRDLPLPFQGWGEGYPLGLYLLPAFLLPCPV